jgi:hypothetical protein
MRLRELYRRATEREQAVSGLGQREHAPGARLRETVPNPTTEDWFWGRASATGSEEDYFWRRLSDNWTMKDVLPGAYLEIHNQCYEAYNANPMANAIVEMGVNFVLGDGLCVEAPHPKVQKLLDGFWHDPDNRMDIRQYEIATELSLYGELFVRFFHICCDSPDWVSHVGIYVGNGMMIDAPYPGAYVRMEPLNTPYWQSHWAGAGRVVIPSSSGGG